MHYENNDLTGQKYKLNDLKVFGSMDTSSKNIKKYRKVYGESECRYLFCELSIYNNHFDVDDWSALVKFVCTDIYNGKKVCELEKEVTISKDRNLMYIREGWGTPEPGWWAAGNYIWEVYLNEEHLGITEFYIVKGGHISKDYNPYFNIKSLRLFESPRDGFPINQRKYLKTFASASTRYLNVEMQLEGFNFHADLFPLELHFNFYNESGQHKAFMAYFKQVLDKKAMFLDTGYGSDNVGFWSMGSYSLEVSFMDKVIASAAFDVQLVAEEFVGVSMLENKKEKNSVVNQMSFEEAKKELDGLIGLKKVKKQINELATYLKFLKIRQDKGLEKDKSIDLHSIFIGNPGTGKTTVAKMLGKIYHSLGLLSTGEVHEVGRADLVGEFIGQTAPKVKKAIEEARGGVLFIDEAYALTDRGDDGKDFGKEVVEVLIKEISDGEGDISIVCAGYQKEMHQFIESNPGLTSRFHNVIQFPDYTPDELLDIAHYKADELGVSLDELSSKLVYKKLIEAYRDRDEKFGNARYVGNIIKQAKQNLALRAMSDKNVLDLPSSFLSTVEKEDVERIFSKNSRSDVMLDVDNELLQETLAALHELVGMTEVKEEVDELVKLVKYYHEIGKDVKSAFQLHTVFIGEPGTGKTTVARLFVQLYKALGILERGHLIETDRKGLIAGYVGQTAIKAGELIDKAMGGGLFIDEAYGLTEDNNSFGKEAIEVLLKKMEDHRGEFMVIVAGYPKEMNRFLNSNPGLMSRFDKQFVFKDYTFEELVLITKILFDREELRLEPEAEIFLKEKIQQMVNDKMQHFGNARIMRKLVFEAIKNQNLRMAGVSSKNRDWISIHTIKLEDIQGIKLLKDLEMNKSRTIGFK